MHSLLKLRQTSARGIAHSARLHASTQPRNSSLNAFTSQTQHHESPEGKTIAIKDNIVTSSAPTTAASHILVTYTSPFDATVVARLQEYGYTLAQKKANLDEFGMGSHNQNSAHGTLISPYSRGGIVLSPGGSSGGSAVAVATGESWAALGTDTGGSVRLPAAYTGVVGFKPSYGRVSRWGVIQYANSLDTVGVLARDVRGAREVWGVLDGFDGMDPTSLPVSVRERMKRRAGMKGEEGKLRIGVPVEYNIVELSSTVRNAYIKLLDRLQSVGHTLHAVSLPSTRQALSAYYTLAPAEASSNLAKYDGIRYGRRTEGPDASPKEGLPLYAQTRDEGFGEEVKRRIILGAYTLSSEAMDNYFIQAQKVRRLVQRDFDAVFAQSNPLIEQASGETDNSSSGVDILLTPTAPTLPPTVDAVARQTPVENYMNDVFTVPASLAGLPAISVPVQLDAETRKDMDPNDVSSVGMQVIGQFGDDEMALQAAEEIERHQL